jgi:hypothetical protein
MNAFRPTQPPPRDLLPPRPPEQLQQALEAATWTNSQAHGARFLARVGLEPHVDVPQVGDDDAEPAGIAGVWAPDASACSPRTNGGGLLPAVINSEGAWAGETSCRFERLKRTGTGWQSGARCANGQERWSSKVRLSLSGDRLVWASERGSQTYVRCAQALL